MFNFCRPNVFGAAFEWSVICCVSGHKCISRVGLLPGVAHKTDHGQVRVKLSESNRKPMSDLVFTTHDATGS